MTEFEPFPKIARLFRDVVITEKIDGTNAAIGIEPVEGSDYPAIYAQSRKRLITPEADNFGFARWVYENYETLVADLGPGLHFGEWWGSGIQRGYGLPPGERRFSLFNTKRWHFQRDIPFATPNLDVVPVLYNGLFRTVEARVQLWKLEANGSVASPGFMKPEGIVIYHRAANTMFKATIENDEMPKALAVGETLDWKAAA